MTVDKKSKNIFWVLVALEIVLIFILNSNHQNQQYIFEHRYIPLAHNIIDGNAYGVLYPIWGYPILLVFGVLLNSAAEILLLIQGILCLASIWLFYKYTRAKSRYHHLFLLLPFIALMSVKWPDAPVAFLTLLYIYAFKNFLETNSIKYLLISGIAQGIILNFRSEYLFIFLILFALSPFVRRALPFSRIAKFSLLSSIIAFCCLLPWGIYTYSNFGSFKLGSTNSGLVLYTTLGQLPNNPWHIEPTDKFGEEFAYVHGIKNAYSISGDSLLTIAFIDGIEKEPIAYAEKVGFNIVSIFFRGLYTGEYSKIIGSEIIDIVIKIVFVPIFTLLLCLFFYQGFRARQNIFFWFPLLSLVIYKVILVGVVQYEPRHMNTVYLLVVAGALSVFPLKRRIR